MKENNRFLAPQFRFMNIPSKIMKLLRLTFQGRSRFAIISGLLMAYFFVGGAACQSGSDSGSSSDSSLINNAYAQTETKHVITDSIYTSRQTAITRAVAKASPGVVGINVTQVKRYRERNPFAELFPELYRNRWYKQEIQSLGSGFLISKDGYIITNEHVVEDATEIVITLPDGRHKTAQVEGSDRLSDIALLKIIEPGEYPYLELGRSDDLMVGEWVIALGNPFGLVALNDQPTVTVGVISALDRDWGRTREERLYQDMIQTDAAINHGNSGGPLVNALGQVIGMNTFIYTGSQGNEGNIGIGFAIPMQHIEEVVAEIREKGGIDREYWHGIIYAQSLNNRIVNALGLSVRQGAIITEIDRRGPAYKAGLREYDIIVALEGKSVTNVDNLIKNLRDLDLKVGSVITFDVVREERKFQIQVTLESRPERR